MNAFFQRPLEMIGELSILIGIPVNSMLALLVAAVTLGAGAGVMLALSKSGR